MVNYRVIFELMIVNILRALLVRKQMELFLRQRKIKKRYGLDMCVIICW